MKNSSFFYIISYDRVLDGVPRTYEEAKYIFTDRGDDDTEPSDETDETDLEIDEALKPTVVAIIDGDDSILKERIMNLPESKVVGTHNTEEGFVRRLKTYRHNNNIATTDIPQSYFETVGKLDTMLLSLDAKNDTDLMGPIQVCVEAGGKPANFQPSPEAILKLKIAKNDANEKLLLENTDAEAEKMAKVAEMEAKVAQAHAARLEEISQQEKIAKDARDMSIRSFLMANIIPSLTEGLVEVCKIQPNDPTDYLSEWFVRNVDKRL